MNLIELKDVTKKYKNKIIVDKVSISVEKGQVFGLIGPNGAGKSTIIAMIATLLKADKGEILYKGINIGKNSDFIRMDLGYIPQDIALYSMLSGYDNLLFWGKVYHTPKEFLLERIEKIQDIIDLSKEQLKNPVSTYSGGMKRRLNIGVALLHNPKIVLMDEPTVGIDIQSVNQILRMIKLLKKNSITVIYTGHVMNEIEEICDSICIIDKGKVIVSGNKEELLYRENRKISLRECYLKLLDDREK